MQKRRKTEGRFLSQGPLVGRREAKAAPGSGVGWRRVEVRGQWNETAESNQPHRDQRHLVAA